MHHTTDTGIQDQRYRRGQLVRIAGRAYRVVKAGATVDGVEGLVLLGALTKSRGGAAGEGHELLALTPDEIDAQQVVPTSRRTGRVVRSEVIGKAAQVEDEGQSTQESSEGQSPIPIPTAVDLGVRVLALLIFVVVLVAVTLIFR